MAQGPIFGRLKVGDLFEWGTCPDIFERIKQKGTKGRGLVNARAIKGTRVGQEFFFGPGEPVRPVDGQE